MIKEKECAVEGCTSFPSTGLGLKNKKEIGLCPDCYTEIKVAFVGYQGKKSDKLEFDPLFSW